MDAKDSFVVFLLLSSLGLFGSLTYCVWSLEALDTVNRMRLYSVAIAMHVRPRPWDI